MIYLVRVVESGKEQKSLITLPQKDVKETRIIGFDRIFLALFGP